LRLVLYGLLSLLYLLGFTMSAVSFEERGTSLPCVISCCPPVPPCPLVLSVFLPFTLDPCESVFFFYEPLAFPPLGGGPSVGRPFFYRNFFFKNFNSCRLMEQPQGVVSISLMRPLLLFLSGFTLKPFWFLISFAVASSSLLSFP